MSIRAFVPLFVLATVTLVLLLALRPLSTSRALAIWILLVTASVLYSLVRGRRDEDSRATSRFEAALRRPKETEAEALQLVRLERELALGIASSGQAERRLLPRLRSIATARLVSGYGIEPDRRPDAARAILGDDAWGLLRPDRPRSEDPREPGVSRRQVIALIERLETL